MKKILIALVAILLFTGCENKMMDTPTKKVEMFLSKYQTLDTAVLDDLDKVIAEEENFNQSQREKYRDIMKAHYQALTYHVKEERIDGDTATVSVQIEVTDFSKKMAEAEAYSKANPTQFQNAALEYDPIKYSEYLLDQLKPVKDRVTYTLDLVVTKQNDKWTLSPISDMDMNKINGVYRQ